MKRLLIFLLWPTLCFGQAWSGVIDPSRAVDWSTAGVQGGIPTNRTQCGSTVAAGTYTGAAIANLINACAANTFLLLGSGTFTISSGICITANNVTLRGAGANSTFLVFTGNSGCSFGPSTDIGIQGSFNWEKGPQHTTTWTGTTEGGAGVYPVGATHLTIGSASGLSTGQYLILDQDNDRTTPASGMVSADATLKAGSCQDEIYSQDNSGTPPWASAPGRNAGLAGTVSGASTACNNGAFPDRNQFQIVKVTNISGLTATISPGIYAANWRSSQNPGAWWATNTIVGVGIENLSMDHSGSPALVSGILIDNAANCWVKGVRSIKGGRNHIWWQYTSHIEVRDSYFFATFNAASQSYGVESWPSSDGRIENNIFHQVTTPHLHGGTTGTVFAYNYAIHDFYNQSTNYLIQSINEHDAVSYFNLSEGNIGSGFWADQIHGTHNLETVYRNYFVGTEYCVPPQCGSDTLKNQHSQPFNIMTHSRYFNLIGNVLGLNGFHTVYQTNYPGNCNNSNPSLVANFNVSIYGVGWSADIGNANMCDANIQPDLPTRDTLMRWANYDVVTGAVRFCGNSSDTGWSTTCASTSEIPTTSTPFAQPVPSLGDTGAGQGALPASVYLSAKPSWWNSEPWPPIGPDVSGGTVFISTGSTSWSAATGLAGHANNNPAQDCYKNIMSGPADGSGSALTFSAATCYPAAGGSPTVSLSPTSLSFGNQPLQVTSSAQTVTLTNTGTATLTITSITRTGTNPGDYAISSNTCGASLGVGLNCVVGVTFTPTAVGSRTANLTFTTNASTSPDNAALSGTGQAPVASFNPTSLSFGGIKLGLSSASQAITLTNTGNATMSISSISLTGTNTGDFSQNNTCSATLAVNANCTITVTFSPVAIGPRTANVSVLSNTVTSPDTAGLSGVGFNPIQGQGTISGTGTIKVQP